MPSPIDPDTSTSIGAQLLHSANTTETTSTPAGSIAHVVDPERQLDVNVIHLPAGDSITAFRQDSVDVLWVLVAGSGTVTTDGSTLSVQAGDSVWVRRGSLRGVVAGPNGLSYVSAHQRKYPEGTAHPSGYLWPQLRV